VNRARRIRKLLGGGMRQVGILAACGIVALEKMIDRLVDDHKKAKKFAIGLSDIKGFKIDPEEVETNIVITEVERDPEYICDEMGKRGVLALPFGKNRIRFVFHKDIMEEDVDIALSVIRSI
jgi:threonine aldolase